MSEKVKNLLSTDIINIISKYCDYCDLDLDFDIPFFDKHLDKVNWSFFINKYKYTIIIF